MDGNIEESLALLLEGGAKDEQKVCLPTLEERSGLVAASGRAIYCIEEGREAIPAVKLERYITSLAYSGNTLFAACEDIHRWDTLSEIVDVGRHKVVNRDFRVVNIIPFQDSVAGTTRDGKIIDFGRNKKIAYIAMHKYAPICSDGNSLFHADIEGVVYNTLKNEAIARLQDRIWCLHPHNGDILAGIGRKIVSVKGNAVIHEANARSFGSIAQICTEGDRIFYLTLCDGAVYEAAPQKRLKDFDARCILVDKGKLYAGTQKGEVMIWPLDGPADGRMEVKAVSKTRQFNEPIVSMAMVPMSLWKELAANNGRGI